MIYYDVSEHSLWVIPLSIIFHIIWDETLTYWAHRFLHTYRFLYLKLHIVHHRSISITPFAGFAFHPLDAFLQALPTFTSSFFFPIHYNIFLGFSVATTIWAISIHDNIPAIPCKLFLYATHHTIHHEKGRGSFRNYGKFTSIWDRMMGSYEDPDRISYGWKSENKEKFFKPFNDFLSRTFDHLLVKKSD
jgi:lathosterol oxidase